MNGRVLVVVKGGVAYTYVAGDVDVQVVDIDNIGSGDPPVKLPYSFSGLVDAAGLSGTAGAEFVKVAPYVPGVFL